MAIEAVLIKTNAGFSYATDADKDSCSALKIGAPIKMTITKQSARSLKFHQRYWAGLISITFEYWEPDSDMTTEAERALVSKFAKSLDAMIDGGGEVELWGNDFLSLLSQSRAKKIQAPNKTKNDLHDWIKEKVGHYETVVTPTGIKKKLKSINFNSMCDEDFKIFYKKAFNVCWKYVLSTTFKTEQESENAINQLLSVG